MLFLALSFIITDSQYTLTHTLGGPSESLMVRNSLERLVPNTSEVLGTHRSPFHGNGCAEGGQAKEESLLKGENEGGERGRWNDIKREKVLNSVWLVSGAVWWGSTTCLMCCSMCQAYALRHIWCPYDNKWRWIQSGRLTGCWKKMDFEGTLNCGLKQSVSCVGQTKKYYQSDIENWLHYLFKYSLAK